MVGDGGDGEERGNSGRIRGRRSVWAPEGGHITFLYVLCPTPTQKHCHIPTATISKPPSQEPKEDAPEASILVARESELALEVPSLAASPASEVAIPAHMTSLCLSLGGIKRV